MITVAQAAKILGVSRVRVCQLCRAGRIEGANQFGNAWMIPTPFKVLPPQKRKRLTTVPDVE